MDEAASRAARLWAMGDYDAIAPHLAPVARAVVDAVGPEPGERVLDVAAGTGNVALLAAEAGGRVTALELSHEMLRRGRRRSELAGHDVEWVAGDALALPFPDGAFDAAVSVLGVMFAPDPASAAAELVRVTRPGGRIGVASWTRGGLSGVLGATIGAHMPQSPPGVVDPHDWGDPAFVARLFGDAVEGLRGEERALTWRFPGPGDAMALLESNSAPFVAARGRLGDAWPAVRAELLAVLERDGRTGPGGFEADMAYLLVTARVRVA